MHALNGHQAHAQSCYVFISGVGSCLIALHMNAFFMLILLDAIRAILHCSLGQLLKAVEPCKLSEA